MPGHAGAGWHHIWAPLGHGWVLSPPQHPAGNGEKFQVKHDKRFKYANHGQTGDKRCSVLPGCGAGSEREVYVKLWGSCWSCGSAAPAWIELRGCRAALGTDSGLCSGVSGGPTLPVLCRGSAGISPEISSLHQHHSSLCRRCASVPKTSGFRCKVSGSCM